MAGIDPLIRDRVSSYKKSQKKKIALLSDAGKMDKYVSGLTQQLSPTRKIAKKSKAASLVDRVDLRIDDSSSMKGFGQEFRSNFASELAKPENAGYSTKAIATGITKSMLSEVGPKGKTRLERAYEDYRVDESSRSNFFGLGSGKSKNSKPPSAPAGMKLYSEWKKDRRAEEDVSLGKEYTPEGYLKSVKLATTIGAYAGAGIAAVAGQLGPQVATPEEIVTVPVAAAIGGLVTGVGETLAYPFRRLIDGTEWGRARKGKGGFKNTAKLLAVKYGPDLAVTGGAEVKLLKSVLLSDTLKKLAIAKPTAQRVTVAKQADDAVTKIKNAPTEPLNIRKGKGVKHVMRNAKINNLDTPNAEKVKAGKLYGALSPEGKVVANADPDGLIPGIYKQSEIEESIAFAEGKQTADAMVKKEVKPTAKQAATTTKVDNVRGEVAVGKAEVTVTEPKQLLLEHKPGGAETDAIMAQQSVVHEAAFKKSQPGKETMEVIGRNNADDQLSVTTETVAQDFKTGITPTVDTVTKDLVKEADSAFVPTTKSEIRLAGLYDKVGDYYDELIVKYNPELSIPDRTRVISAADIEMEEALARASVGLEKKLTKAETNKLNSLLTNFDDIERTVIKMREEIPDITIDNMRSSMTSIIKSEKAGEVTATETLQQVEDLSLRVARSPTLLNADKNEVIGKMAEYSSRLRKQSGILSFMAAFGVGAAVMESFTPGEAEAANLGSILSKGLSKEVLTGFTKKTITALEKKQLAIGRITSDKVFHIPANGFQTGLKETAQGGAKYFLNNINTVYRSTSKSLVRNNMSPQMQFNLILNATEGKLINPAVFKASFFTAESNSVRNGLRVIANIFKDSEIITAEKEVAKLFDPLLPKASNQYLHDYHKEMVNELTTKLGKMKKPDKETAKSLRHDIHKHQGMVKKLEPEVVDYHASFQVTAEEAATKFSSSRVFFAADDTAKFDKYPFLKRIPFTQNEKLAVGRLKRQMGSYRVRLEQNKVKTFSGEFMHYNMHPKMEMSMLADLTGDSTATPYMRNFTRSLNSRPLLPDAVASMSRYVPDTERRIQTQAFWNSGWGEVMNRSSHIEPLKNAFEALRDGSAPFENTWTNKLARWYTNIEVFKRLFLSPSAGLKHLVKLTGDMSTLGIRTTVGSIPGAVKGVSHRIIEDTPFLKKVASNLYNPSSYTKMKKQLLDSVAPVVDTRYRMQQMGFGNYDTQFSKLSILADEVNHVGGVFINMAELIDRSTTMEAGMRIAAKKGMSPNQAIYGIYDTILKNNFLGREFTPQWLRNPITKAALMFQTTPYKIFEKRAVVATRSGKAIKNMGKQVYNATKTESGRAQLYSDLKTLYRDMTTADQEMKVNLFLDSLKNEQDFYGNSVVKQFIKDLIIMGAGTAAAGSVGLNMSHHFFHVPLLKSSTYSDTYGTLALSPVLNAINDGSKVYNKKIEEGEDTIRMAEIMQKWMGKAGPYPDTLWKYNRISNDDIPDIYQDSPFQYLFAIPSNKEN
jgi:hypothetical protein